VPAGGLTASDALLPESVIFGAPLSAEEMQHRLAVVAPSSMRLSSYTGGGGSRIRARYI
jgi:hypothetical protein